MEHELIRVSDAEALADQASELVAARAREAVRDHGRFRFAASGGKTPWTMFTRLAELEMPWEAVEIFQVDERVAPDGDPDRNLTHLRDVLGHLPVTLHPMAVTASDLNAAAAAYARGLPDRFDLVHLGLGPDGHTASLVPGDPVLEVTDHLVALTGAYQGHQRMTLTYPALARADELLWLVSGRDKKAALAKLIAGDRAIPASAVQARRSTIIADGSTI